MRIYFLVYILNGVIHKKKYFSENEMKVDWNRLIANKKILAAMKFKIDFWEEYTGLIESKFNKPALWKRIPESVWPESIREHAAQQAEDPCFLGTHFEYWQEGQVYLRTYTWSETETGRKYYQRVLFDTHGMAVRWCDAD